MLQEKHEPLLGGGQTWAGGCPRAPTINWVDADCTRGGRTPQSLAAKHGLYKIDNLLQKAGRVTDSSERISKDWVENQPIGFWILKSVAEHRSPIVDCYALLSRSLPAAASLDEMHPISVSLCLLAGLVISGPGSMKEGSSIRGVLTVRARHDT